MASLREHVAMSDFGNAHQRNHDEYSHRLPGAPPIVVPAPTFGAEITGIVMSDATVGEADVGFLQEIELHDIIQNNTLLEWSYDRRRHAQMLLPWLYFGPMLAARDAHFLQTEGITMALAIRTHANSMKGAMAVSREVCAEVATIEVPSFHALISRFDETTSMINMHMARVRTLSLEKMGQPALGKVLVFCESGNEKSAAVAAAYLMTMLNDFNHLKAMQVCQAQRFCVNFDDTLKNILQSYWDILQARRCVASYHRTTGRADATTAITNGPVLTSTKQKRTLENTFDYDDDLDMDNALYSADALRFAGRDYAPFQNRDV